MAGSDFEDAGPSTSPDEDPGRDTSGDSELGGDADPLVDRGGHGYRNGALRQAALDEEDEDAGHSTPPAPEDGHPVDGPTVDAFIAMSHTSRESIFLSMNCSSV